MTLKTLGWGVIVYTGLQSVVFPQALALIIALIMKQRLLGTWYESVTPAVWLALLIGAIGLVRCKTWGRWTVVAACAGTIVASLIHATTILLHGSAVDWAFLAMVVIVDVPSAVILAAALRLKFPEPCEQPAPDSSGESARDSPSLDADVRKLDSASAWNLDVPGRNTLIGVWTAIAVAVLAFFCVRWFGFVRKRRLLP